MKNEGMFKEYMLALSELHGKDLSPLLFSLYWKTLEPFTDQECELVFKKLVFSARFFPKPVDFLEILRGKIDDQGARAWIQVVDAVRRHGNYQTVRFADPIIHSVIEFMGGWGKTGEWYDSELKWKQKEFEKLYGIMQRNNKHPEHLPGLCEIENAANGHDRQPDIIQIGFGQKVKEIAA